jgi:hypothetical protein
MKKIHTLASLLEQAATEVDAKSTGTKIEITGSVVTMTKADKVRIKWPYKYTWPASNPTLGDIAEFVKVLNADQGGKGGKSILDQIKKIDDTHIVGIATDAESTQKDRLLRKDLGQIKGFVYLFHPNTINKDLVPADKQLPKIGTKFTFVVDADWQKYLVTTAPAADSTATVKAKDPIKAESFISADGINNDWYGKTVATIIGPVVSVINSFGDAVPIEKTGKSATIFWQFMSAEPTHSWAVDMPGNNSTYTELLQSKIKTLLDEAAKFDKSAFSGINTNSLTSYLYKKMAHALIVVGLNSGELTNASTPDSAPKYFKPLTTAKAQSGTSAKPAEPAEPAEPTTAFDGTAINNEMDLAKIISGGLIAYNIPAADVDTLDKVKAKWDSYVPAKYTKKFSEIVAKLPFNSTTNTSLAEFKNIQFFAINQNGTYGQKTKAGFKSAFEKSSLK